MMTINLPRFTTLLAAGLFLCPLVNASNEEVKSERNIVYPCNLSPTELISSETSRVLRSDPAAIINFEFHTTFMRENEVLVENEDNWVGSGSKGRVLKTQRIMIPFATSDFRKGDSFDAQAFDFYVSEQLSRLKAREPNDGFKCGDYPPDTVIVEMVNSCLLGKLETEFTGEIHPQSGNEEWAVVRSSEFRLSDKTECKPHITKR